MIEDAQITRTMLPILIGNWILGMGVIQYPVGNSHPKISWIYSLFVMIVYYSLTAIAYPHIISTMFIYSHSKVPIVFLFYCNLLLTLGMNNLSWHCCKGLQHYVTKSAIVDNLMEHIGITVNYRQMTEDLTRKIIISFSIIGTVFCINAYLMMSLDTPFFIRILISLIFAYPIIMVNASDITFISCIKFARYRFQALNNFLESTLTFNGEMQITSLCKSQSFRVYGSNNIEKDHPDFMIFARRIHLQLIKICQETDRVYAMNILLSIGVSFILLTGNTYLAFTSIFMEKRSTTYLNQEIPFWIMWTAYYLIKIFLLSLYCHKCEQEALLTGKLINKMYDEPWVSNETQSKILDFNIQMIQRPLEFSAGGYVTLDLCLVQVMIHTITTYLVIIIQLGQVYSKKSCSKIGLTNAYNITSAAN